MDRLSDCIQAVHLRWLASSFSCCFPRLPDQSEPDIPGECRIAANSDAFANFMKLLTSIGRSVTSNHGRCLRRKSALSLHVRHPEVPIVQVNGWPKDECSRHGPRAAQASPNEPSSVDRPLGPRWISEKSNSLGHKQKSFGRWN